MDRIIYLDRSILPTTVRRPAFRHEWLEYPMSSPEEVKARLQGATIAITHRVFVKGGDLPPTLRLIAVGSTGYERIDLTACRARGIHVSNVRGWSASVPEHVFALALALRRHLFAYNSAVRSGAWSSSPDFSLANLEILDHTLRGDTLGIIGFGALGRSVAALGHGFGMEILVAERQGAAALRVGRVPFCEVLRKSDVLAVLCPLTPETHGLIGADELALMKRNALLINCARGGIVDEDALAGALAAGRIGVEEHNILQRQYEEAVHQREQAAADLRLLTAGAWERTRRSRGRRSSRPRSKSRKRKPKSSERWFAPPSLAAFCRLMCDRASTSVRCRARRWSCWAISAPCGYASISTRPIFRGCAPA